ncbi:MAG: hypothetical protein NWR02_03050 [Mycobacterium sp.]|nr:hypothetical protein [Mycobacterium sp.]
MLDTQELFRAVVTLSALFASTAWYLSRPSWPSMLSALGLAILWPFVDKPLTGKLLMVISEQDGVTQADLISVFVVVVVAIREARPIVKARWHHRKPEQTPD